ncbi:MAG TPA: polysaccharide biosynthesis/export family protein [Mariprofundaceae bacterium]|nr:polysaccharide biosynthesis/export family protein [Mariprofundaceae bacterium]
MVSEALALNSAKARIMIRAAAMLLASALLPACSSMSLGSSTTSGVKVEPLTMAELQQQEAHRISPLDELEVVVWGVPEFESNAQATTQASAVQQAGYLYEVHDDGTIELPLLGSVSVAGLSVEEAKQHIAKLMTRFVEEPNVSVTISRYNSRKILVLGEVKNPGIVQNPGPRLSLAEALAQAGGMDLMTANHSHVYIIRGGLKHPKIAHVGLDTAVGMFEAQQIWLKSRDIVFVDSRLITDWNRFISQLLPTIGNAALLKSMGVY